LSPNDAAPTGPSPPAARINASPVPAPEAGRAQRWRAMPIALALGLSLGAFVTLAFGIVLAMGYIGARRTTYELLRDRTVGTLECWSTTSAPPTRR
jgi:hypothetical protein